jgi:surface antigen
MAPGRHNSGGRRQPRGRLEADMNPIRLLPLLLIAASLSQSAQAQINPFRGSRGAPLTADDITALTDATNRLLDRPNLATGGTETWSNPQSGLSGVVTAGNAVQRRGMACRVMNYQTTVPNRRTERSTRLTWCKTKDGWKIA